MFMEQISRVSVWKKTGMDMVTDTQSDLRGLSMLGVAASTASTDSARQTQV